MRNLKRVLSLALATVMLLGMMVIGAGAADEKKTAITDLDKAVNKEAVTLMVDLGIIVGKPDGTFAPTEIVDRATMAKMIYFILMGTADESSFKGVSTPLTDVKGNWAEGFINYCYSMKIVAGVGDNKFNPSGKVTVASAAKMLLVALGYDAKLSKYEGDAMWSVNIMRDAQKAGLMESISQKSTEELTRDNAAQMIFNALNARTVVAVTDRDQGVQYLTKYEANATTLGNETYNLFKVTAVVAQIDTDGSITVATKSPAMDGSLETDINKLTGTSDMLGNTIAVYYKADYKVVAGAVVVTSYKKLISTKAVTASAKVLSTTNDGTKLADLTKKGDKKYVGDLEIDANIKYFVNGNDVTTTYNAAADATHSTFDTKYAKTGIIIELINNDDDAAIDVVKVTEKKVVTLSGDVATKDVAGADTQVKVPGIINAFTSDNTVKTVVGYADLKKGDVVLTYKVGSMTYIEKAATIEGKVASLNSSNEVKVDGTYYKASGLVTSPLTGWNDYTNTFTFYLDNAKAVVKTKQTSDEKSSEYVLVLAAAWKAGTGGIEGGSGVAEARILNLDGTTQVVTVSKQGGDKLVEGTAGTGEHKFVATELAGKFVTYKTDKDGKYEVTLVANNAKDEIVVGDITDATITSGKAVFAGTTVGNASTIFLVKSGTATSPVYKVYTGIANVPGMTIKTTGDGNTLALNSEVVTKKGIATHVFLNAVGGTLSGETGEYLYIVGKTATDFKYENMPKSDTVAAHIAIKGIVNGEAADVKLDAIACVGAGNAAINANTMYKVDAKDADGIITQVTAVVSGDAAANVNTGFRISGDTLLLNNASSADHVITVDADSSVYLITKDGSTKIDYSAIESDKNDQIIVAKKNSKNYANIVYIMQVISEDASATTKASATIGGAAIADNKIGTITWAGGDGKTQATAKTATITVEVATAAKDGAFTFTLNSTDSEATVSLVSGTVPATGVAKVDTELVFQVAAEDGSTVCYYKLTLNITNA